MPALSLRTIVRAQPDLARDAQSARSSTTVCRSHEHALRQPVVALLAGAELGDHENPGEATLQPLHGRVRLRAGCSAWEAQIGDLLIIPDNRHALEALEDSAVLLTAVPRSHIR
jgi:quercetin dioxygenase-like cupin family protein